MTTADEQTANRPVGARGWIRAAVVLVVVLAVGFGIAVAGGQGGRSVAGLPITVVCVAVAFAVQWVLYVPAYLRQTERFYDLAGSGTYILVVLLALVLAGATDPRALLLAALVIVWAARLGTFLVRRIRQAGKDDRFDAIKRNAPRFLVTWTIQGLWVSLTAAAALAAITTAEPRGLGVVEVVGLLLWLAGFGLEAVADQQKRRFRADPANRGRFIATGVWAWSRHPNYAGEITLWTGVALIALPVLSGWALLTLISPVFVTLLLTRASGVPLLERKADATWGGQPDYEAYKARTPVLVPRPPRG